MEQREVPEQHVAIIGMAGRFPGASTLDQFWQNLRAGKETISTFSDEELRAAGVEEALLRDPHYVRAQGMLDDIDLFDAPFFGYSPREAELIDPQQRIFLEESWHALEDAGYNPETFAGRIGVFAGMSMSTYLLYHLVPQHHRLSQADAFQMVLGNDKDYLPTRVAYKLNLRGPAIAVQTACSTSLVAVHLACQSVLNGECDIALAGGVSISVTQNSGYLYQEGGISSPDGHCRAFDALAQGTVSGNGIGIVVLKRLADALHDGDYVHAVICGSAINNDGAYKVGYTAPSIDGQAEVIADALALANVDPAQVSYVEAHGTGTALGDPIELAALTQVYRATSDRNAFCALGSVKTNIGHLDAAAGVAGVIKTVLALRHRQIPPSLHFERPAPDLKLETSPFYVNARLSPWETGNRPRIAGVSSFGIGGTNAHVLLAEAPAVPAVSSSTGWQLLLLSARTETALEAVTARMAAYLRQHPERSLADVAYTCQIGRKAFAYRRAMVCRDPIEAALALETPQRVMTRLTESEERPIVFMFPGQGTQYAGMARDLYRDEPVFRAQVDHCLQLLSAPLGRDIRALFYPETSSEDAEDLLTQTALSQVALFVVEYALAQLLLAWGIRPSALLGHSLGEYTAACLAGVFSLEDTLALVAARGRLMQQLPTGSMLSVTLAEEALRPLLNDRLSLAAVNGPTSCVIAGETMELEGLRRRFGQQGVECQLLRTAHAFHSFMMEPAMEPFAALVARVARRATAIPLISNVTGTWLSAEQATDAHYWSTHMRQTVRFAAGVKAVLNMPQPILLEVGPGSTLGNLVRQQTSPATAPPLLATLRRAHQEQEDTAFLLETLGKLWLHGVNIDWQAFSAHQPHHRLPLPTYPFERQRYWIGRPTMPRPADAPPGANTAEERGEHALHPRPALATAYDAPRNEMERTIAPLWQEVLGIERIGIHDDFFELGGHSILATQLLARLRDTFPVEVPLSSLFAAPTIAQLAEAIEGLLIEKIALLSEEEIQGLL